MELIIRGKRIVIGIIAIILSINVATIVSTMLVYVQIDSIGFAALNSVKGLIRLLLEIGILFCLYKGHNWARWLLVILLGLGGLISLYIAIPLFNAIDVFGVIYLMLGIIYIAIFIILIVSKAIKAFMTYQRDGDIYNYESINSKQSDTILKD
jgi:hypothetical protein